MLPAPPRATSSADFVVNVFTVMVATILTIAFIGTLSAFIFTDKDVGSLLGSLLDIITTIIGALVGFIAGKGSGRAEVHDELKQLPPQPPPTATAAVVVNPPQQ